MSRGEKIGAFALGGVLFAGLFYFIYTTMKNPAAGDLTAAEDFLDEEDFAEEFDEQEAEAPAAAAPEAKAEKAAAGTGKEEVPGE